MLRTSCRRRAYLPAAAGPKSAIKRSEGKNVAAWDADHSSYVLVGDVPRESLVAFATKSKSLTPR